MTSFTVREYQTSDISALTSLWCKTFGDSEQLISRFFALLPEMGTGLVAVIDEKPVGAAYIICAMQVVDGKEAASGCGYLYAVAVDESCRGYGLGKALSIAAAEKGRSMGAKTICTLPAEHSLYKYYEDIIGVKTALYRKKSILPCAQGALPQMISAEQYLMRREALLLGRARLRLSKAAMEFQEALCREYGGGLYAFDEGIACAYLDEGDCIIRELICADNADAKALACALGYALGAKRSVLFEAASEGDEYIAADEGRIPADCVWNLSFD